MPRIPESLETDFTVAGLTSKASLPPSSISPSISGNGARCQPLVAGLNQRMVFECPNGLQFEMKRRKKRQHGQIVSLIKFSRIIRITVVGLKLSRRKSIYLLLRY